MSYTDADTDALIEQMLIYLDLPRDDAFRVGIKLNLETAQRIAAPLLAIEFDDETEPAPVFEA